MALPLPGLWAAWGLSPGWGVTCFILSGVTCRALTSYMKMSKTRVATGRGKVVRKSVRNQDEAYMDVWKLCERKWVFRSGSCSYTVGEARRAR